ncbi:hypothetical protein NDU88_004703 [Pleurodeles waltl]|uniref:Uncharacterized protein n=1 Tax=Pleurodeles waltl TaxID=8319 RepID=A0AAV7NQ26_PLEWA|nr:hypothetical protein NDU88_004703 [Pleurodeles waltl]
MSAWRRSHAGEEAGAASWSRAALEHRRSRRAAAHVSLRGIGGRRRGSTSTSCPAIPQKPPMLECAEPLDLDRQSSKSAHEVGAFISTSLPARSLSATSKFKTLCAHKDNAGAQKLGNKRGDFCRREEDCNVKKTKLKQKSVRTSTRVTPSLRTYFRALPIVSTTSDSPMSEDKVTEGGSAPNSAVDLPPNLPSDLHPSSQEANEVTGGIFVAQETPHHLAGAETVGTAQMLESLPQSTSLEPSSWKTMFVSLTESIKKGFLTSRANQAEIKFACESLEKKIDLLALQTQALEESVETMREDLRKNKEEIQQLKGMGRDLQEKLEYLENNSRRNNLRILNVPEGVEGSDLKRYIVSLIKKVIPLDETEDQIFNDIQREHRNPFSRNLSIKKQRRILANFLTYSLKEKIIGKALNLGSLETGVLNLKSGLTSLGQH